MHAIHTTNMHTADEKTAMYNMYVYQFISNMNTVYVL